MEVFVWVNAGEAKVYHSATIDDLEFILAELNDYLSLWDRLLMPLSDLQDAYGSGGVGAAKAAIMVAVTPIIKDYSDDRFEAGTGFTTLKGSHDKSVNKA